MSFQERLRAQREARGMTQAALAEALGVSKSAVGNYETGVSMPREETLLRLFQVLEVEPNYLFQDSYDSGSVLTPQESALLARWRGLSAKGKRAVDALLDVAEEARSGGSVRVLPEKKAARYIPLFLSPAAAGYPSPVLGEEYEMVPVEGNVPDNAQLAIRIQGDSMEPYIMDRSIVYVGREPLENGDVGVFCVDGDTFCKQYYKDLLGMVYLLSLNRRRADADVVLPPTSNRTLSCFGRVLLKRRPPLPPGAVR